MATRYAEPLKSFLESIPGVTRAEVAGSYRRGRETVGDLDVLVSVCSRQGAAVIQVLEVYGDLQQMSAAGTTKAAGVLRNGLHLDVRVLPPESFGAAQQYVTGESTPSASGAGHRSVGID